MNKDSLLKRLEVLTADKTKLLANINAYEGAIQECSFWLSQMPIDEITLVGVEDIIPSP